MLTARPALSGGRQRHRRLLADASEVAMPCCSATSRDSELIEKLSSTKRRALVLTMDDPVLTVRLAKRLREEHPDLPIIARARDTAHAAALYRAGVTDAVPGDAGGLAAAVRGGAGRYRRGDGPGDRLDPRKAQRTARRDHGSGTAGGGAKPWKAAGARRRAASLMSVLGGKQTLAGIEGGRRCLPPPGFTARL